MTQALFVPENYSAKPYSDSVTWQAPSNIALVKYWGKYASQIPANPSLSFTLNACRTITTVSFELQKTISDDFDITVLLEGFKAPDFLPKIKTFFERIEPYLPFLRAYRFTINTRNTFPHSSGIASSASGLSALALCLISIERLFFNKKNSIPLTDFELKKASFLARLGSGSACRSIEGELVVWGNHPDIKGSSNLYGIKYPYEVHPDFKGFLDTVLLVDVDKKQVSSTVGHSLMQNHPFATQRFKQASKNLTKLIDFFKSGDLEGFIAIVESEALTLHAMMMSSNPYFILMKPQTLEIIQKIRRFRKETNIPVCFTLDAGANVHVLYPQRFKKQVYDFIINQLIIHCYQGRFICDQIGFGAKKM